MRSLCQSHTRIVPVSDVVSVVFGVLSRDVSRRGRCVCFCHVTGDEAAAREADEAAEGGRRGVPSFPAAERQGGDPAEGQGTQAHRRDQEAEGTVRHAARRAQGTRHLKLRGILDILAITRLS